MDGIILFERTAVHNSYKDNCYVLPDALLEQLGDIHYYDDIYGGTLLL